MMRAVLQAIEADISTLALDAVVNAANEPLMMGGGVDGAIRRKAGLEMENEIRKIGRCPTGQAVITRGHRLPARFVIHTVAPMWADGGASDEEKERLLSECYRSSLALAEKNGISSIAFPCLGTGIYGWPSERAAEIAFSTVTSYLATTTAFERVVFCCFNREDHERYEAMIQNI